MSASLTMRMEAELSTGVWTDLIADVLAVRPVTIRYGISGQGPLDRVASPGELSFLLRNDAGNSGSTLGWYSPLHSNVRAGWTFGVGIRAVFIHGASAVLSVSSITRSSQTATVTTSTPHGLATGDWVLIAGATQTEYTGTQQITSTGASTFTYTVVGSPATPGTGTITAVQAYVKFRGRVRTILPEPGQYGARRVAVTAHDGMRELVETDVRELAVAINTDEDDLLHAVLDSLPTAAQPVARLFDPAVDTYPYCFDDVGTGTKAATVLQDLVLSAVGWLTMDGDGALRYRNRTTLQTDASLYSFANAFTGLIVPSSLDGAYNRVRVTIRPRSVDDAATTVLWAITGTAPSISPGASIELWGSYRDPTEISRAIGGTSQVTPLVATTDYLANAAVDGTGTDLTSALSVTTTAFGASARFELTNTGLVTLYVTHLQLRGKGVYDEAPQTFEESSVASYERPLAFEMRYQDSPYIARAAAEALHGVHSVLEQQIESLSFVASVSDDALTRALTLEPGDRITVTETVTGLTAIEARVTELELEVGPRRLLSCRVGLAPVSTIDPWQVGTAGLGELGTTTYLGF